MTPVTAARPCEVRTGDAAGGDVRSEPDGFRSRVSNRRPTVFQRRSNGLPARASQESYISVSRSRGSPLSLSLADAQTHRRCNTMKPQRRNRTAPSAWWVGAGASKAQKEESSPSVPEPETASPPVPMPEPETLPAPKPKSAPAILKPKAKLSKAKSKPKPRRRRRTINVTDDVDDETEVTSEDPITPDDHWISKLTGVDLGPFRPGVLAVEAAAAANPTNTPAMVSVGLGGPDPRNKRMHRFFSEWLEGNMRSVFFFFWNLQDQKVHRYFASSQLGTSWNQPLCSTPEMSNTRYHSLPLACLHSACCGRPTSDGLKALKVLGARYATLRVVRGLGACITHQGLGTILAVCSPGLSRWACGPFLPHWLSRVFQF